MSKIKKGRRDDEDRETLEEAQEVLEDRELEDVAGGLMPKPARVAEEEEEEEEPLQT